jgi:hypothetical protein
MTQPQDCPGQPANQCLRPNGSGWVLVPDDVPNLGSDHCWFQINGCTSDKTPAPGFIDRRATAPYALEPSADWLVGMANTPWP